MPGRLIKEKMDLDIDVARFKVLKADHQSQQYRMEDKLPEILPREIERQTGYTVDLKQTSKRLQLIRRLWKDSAVWKFWASTIWKKRMPVK